MIKNKKIKNGFKKALFGVTLAFVGPVLFMLGFGHQTMNLIEVTMIIIGILLMLSSIILGVLAIKEILAGFFEESNE